MVWRGQKDRVGSSPGPPDNSERCALSRLAGAQAAGAQLAAIQHDGQHAPVLDEMGLLLGPECLAHLVVERALQAGLLVGDRPDLVARRGAPRSRGSLSHSLSSMASITVMS